MRIVWKETLAAGKFGIFVVKLILAEVNLTNLPILGLKIIWQNLSIIFALSLATCNYCVVSQVRPLFSVFICGGGKKGLVK